MSSRKLTIKQDSTFGFQESLTLIKFFKEGFKGLSFSGKCIQNLARDL